MSEKDGVAATACAANVNEESKVEKAEPAAGAAATIKTPVADSESGPTDGDREDSRNGVQEDAGDDEQASFGAGDISADAGTDDAHAGSTGGSDAEGDGNSAADSEGTQDFSDDDDEGKDGYKKGGYHPVSMAPSHL
jgi:hypothetical protein